MASYSSNYLRLLSYTRLLTSHVNQGRHREALSLFHHIHSSLSLSLDPFIFPLALKSCAFLHRPLLGLCIHTHTQKSAFIANPFVACALVDFYGKCVSVLSGRQLFDEIPVRNAVVWNSMISVYTRSRHMDSALSLFEVMDVSPNASTFNTIIMGFLETENGFFNAILFYRQMWERGLVPNLITLLALLRACVGIAALNLIKEIHGYAIRVAIDLHPHFRSGLVEAYGRSACLDKAQLVFDSMQERDVVAWSSLISAYALNGEAKKALAMFEKMEMANIKADELTFLAVLKACSHAGLADQAKMYFVRMHEYGVQASGDHYACFVDALSRAGRLFEAHNVLKGMPMKPTAKAWGALLAACQTFGEMELAEVAGRALFEIEPENPANYVLLARIYASKGRHEEAQRLRREMKKRGVSAAAGSSWVLQQG